MENKKNLIFWGAIAIVGVGLILYGYFLRPVRDEEQPNNPDIVQSPIPTPTLTPVPASTKEPFSGLNGIKAPATCQISGETNFTDLKSYSSNTKISWQNIDSQGRLINWRISPKDDLAIGPNIFANLTVPSGEYENLTVRLPENPISKTYLLTVSVTYGQIIQGDVKVKEVNCTGQIKINLNF
ncbi:MAG: hypothetical protein AAB857_00165 [Patescibacteria group bacterium]